MNGSFPPTSPRDNGHEARHLIELFRSLADPIRLRLVHLLESQPHNGGLSVGELADVLKLPQSTVSRHLKTLTDAGLAACRREGTSTFYRLVECPTEGQVTPDTRASRQLLSLARERLGHDSQARDDATRLAAILRKRDADRRSSTDCFFGKHAPQWDQLRSQWFGETFHLEGLLTLMNPRWIIADVGTGTGAMLPLIAPHVARVMAVDPSAAMLKGARARVRDLHLNNVDIRQGTAEHLPIDTGSVDVALLALVLTYTPSPAAVFTEIRRILKPAGIVLVLDFQTHQVELFREKLNHRHMGFSLELLNSWLTTAGFNNIRWHPISPRQSRTRESEHGPRTPIPDLFALRAEAQS